ncbi:NPCBM/NEW2 domain-containing protein [bacterium]|nr:NPCBM/NEW2 domain-containing protein [bacterium]
MNYWIALLFAISFIFICLADENSPSEVHYLSEHLELIVSFTQGWGELGLDVSAHAPWQTPLPLQIKDKKYEKGLGHHAPGEIIISLNGAYLAFESEIGVQWQGGSNVGSVVFQVFVDGRKVFDSGVMRELDPPRKVRIPLKGADELRLVVTDAGDGIICDCADWANALLIPAPSVKKEKRREKMVDIAPFAKVVYSDPKRVDGCRCSRTEEFPKEDIFLEKEIAPSPFGDITVPKNEDGEGCIGLVWCERRRLKELQLEFQEDSLFIEPEKINLQVWLGESHWQGEWVPVKAEIRRAGNLLIFELNWQGNPALALNGTEKVRLIFPPQNKPLVLRKLSAYTSSIWDDGEFVLELEKPLKGSIGKVSIYNGEIMENGRVVYEKKWDLGQKLILKLRYCRPSPSKSDRTILLLELPNTSFGIAIEDILASGCVYIEEFGVYATTYPEKIGLKEYKRKIDKEKTVLQRVREMPDQTFSQAMAKVHRDVQDNGPTMLSLACDNEKFIVPREGGAQYGNFEARLEFGKDGDKRLKRYLDGGWSPIPVTEVEQGGILYRQRSFVVPLSEDDETTKLPPYWLNKQPLFVAEIEVLNKRDELSESFINLSFFKDRENGVPAKLEETEKGIVICDDGMLLAFLEIPDGWIINDGKLEIRWKLAKGDRKKAILFIPGWKLRREEANSLCLGGQLDVLIARTKLYWEKVLSDAMRVDIPEPMLANVIKASQVHCLIAARNEEKGKRVAPWIASVSYGPLESEAHSIIYGMSLFGHFDFAKRGLNFFISKYNEKGYLTTGYTIVGTGWHLWTLSRFYKLSKDREWLKEVADKVARVCDWITKQREKTKAYDIKGEKMPEWGLMPPGVAADWNRFAYRFFNQAHYYAGLAETAEVLEEVGYEEARRFVSDAREFRQDILRAFRWNQARIPVLKLSNGRWIPAYPGMLYCFGKVGEMYPGEDGNRSWAGDVEIGAHYLIPCGVLDAKSKDADWIVEHMEDYWFLYTGMGEYPEEENRRDWFNLGGFSKLQPYYTRIVEIYALRDEVKPFIRSYFNAIPSLLNRENLSFWEHFHNMGAWNKTHETGWFLVQTRHMFLVERGKELWLAPFLPSYWLKDGERIAVSNAPSYFGRVNYEIESFVKQGYIVAKISLDLENFPDKLAIRLRHPEGKKIKKVLVNGKEHKDYDAERECVFLQGKGQQIEVKAFYE